MRHLATALAVGLVVGCSSGGAVSGDKPDRIPAGEWGGEHVRLTVSDSAAAIEFDCAHGTLEAPLAVDSDGRFDVTGSFTREGGPAVPGGREQPERARYQGTTDGHTMDLEVVRQGGDRSGPFRLKLGERAILRKCL
jgi:hypothetical protein